MYPARQQKYVRLHIADIENEGGCSQDLSRQQSLFPTFSSVRTPRYGLAARDRRSIQSRGLFPIGTPDHTVSRAGASRVTHYLRANQ